MKLRRNLFGPVLSRMKQKRHERRTKSESVDLELTNEVCKSETNHTIVEDEQRNDAEHEEELMETQKMSAKEHQLKKYRINSVKSRPIDLDEYEDEHADDEEDHKERTDSISSWRLQGSPGYPQEKELLKCTRMTTSRQSDALSKSTSTEGRMSFPFGADGTRREDQQERDLPEDDEEVSFRGGTLGKDPKGSNMAEYGKSSQGEDNLLQDEVATSVKRSAKKRRAKAKLVKYMSHREGSEKGFEVLLEDFRKFVSYCTIEKDGACNGQRIKSETVTEQPEKDPKRSEWEPDNDLRKETTIIDDTSNNHSASTNSKCLVVASCSVDNDAEDDGKSVISTQSVRSNKDGGNIDADSIVSVLKSVASVASCSSEIESKCICKCCGHFLENSKIKAKRKSSTDGFSGLKGDIVNDCSGICRSASGASAFKQKHDQNSVESGSRPDDEKILPPLIVSLEDSPYSLPNGTPAQSTKQMETAPETPTNMFFSIFSSLSAINNSNEKNALAVLSENDEIVQDKHEGGDLTSRSDEIERSGKPATRGEKVPVRVMKPLAVAVDESTRPVQTSTLTEEGPPDTVPETPINMFFSMFSSLSTKNNIEVGGNGETRQDIDDRRQDKTNRNSEIERSPEATISAGEKKAVIRKLPSRARPPLPCTSTKQASRYVTYPIRREDSHSSLRSAPPRLSSDFPRDQSKGETTKQVISPSSISQRKDNGWDGRE